MRLFLKEFFFQKFMFFSKKFFLRFLSLRYGADFGRSRLVFFCFFSVDNLTLSGPLFLQFLQFSKSYNYYLAKLKYWRKSSFYII